MIALRSDLRVWRSCLLVGLLLWAAAAQAGQERLFREGKFEQGELRYINDVPVLIVAGTPAEIGRQKAALTAEATKQLAEYPRKFLSALGREEMWAKARQMGEALVPQFPPHHQEELRAFEAHSGMDREVGIIGNTFVDTFRSGFGCSSLMVDAEHSKIGGPLFGRNLDFPNLRMLDKYTLVTVHRPQGKHAFATVGYPGLFGCLTGINDAGLTVAVHIVMLSRDDAPMFNPKGVPYTFCFRQMLEQCATVGEAEKLLRSTERTTKLNLAVCDRREALVLEMTPKTVATRRGEDGLCACTNHFRTAELAVLPWCRRYNALMRSRVLGELDIGDLTKKLHEVNQGALTVQTMIFEPGPLKLHLAFGACPSSAQPLRLVELGPLLSPPRAKQGEP